MERDRRRHVHRAHRARPLLRARHVEAAARRTYARGDMCGIAGFLSKRGRRPGGVRDARAHAEGPARPRARLDRPRPVRPVGATATRGARLVRRRHAAADGARERAERRLGVETSDFDSGVLRFRGRRGDPRGRHLPRGGGRRRARRGVLGRPLAADLQARDGRRGARASTTACRARPAATASGTRGWRPSRGSTCSTPTRSGRGRSPTSASSTTATSRTTTSCAGSTSCGPPLLHGQRLRAARAVPGRPARGGRDDPGGHGGVHPRPRRRVLVPAAPRRDGLGVAATASAPCPG